VNPEKLSVNNTALDILPAVKTVSVHYFSSFFPDLLPE
jgi:hypothetical protein